MDFHRRLLEDRISILPSDVFAKILSNFDLTKLREMKLISKTFKQLISSQAFSADYNYYNPPYDGDAVWALFHSIGDHDPIGRLLCTRHRDSKQVVYSLDPFFRAIVGKNDILRLICAAGSYLLFTVLDDYGSVSLFVLNVFSARLQQLPLPSSHRLNFRVLRHAKIILRYAQLMTTDDVPHYYEYDSLTQVWDITRPTKINNDKEMLNMDNPKSFIMGYPDFCHKVSFNLEGLVYQRQDATRFVDRALEQVDLGDTRQNGWNRVTSCYYGRISERLACIMVRFLDPHTPLAEFPGKAYIFRLTDNWDNFKLLSEVPHHLVPPGFKFVDASSLHETHNSLNISLEVTNYGNRTRQLMLLKFDKTSHTWTHIVTNVICIERVFHPVYTDGFTIVPT